MELTVNGTRMNVTASEDTPLLWALRDHLGLTGTKFGCGMALCGACTVHVDGAPTRACVTPISALAGKKIVTIEGVSVTPQGKAVQRSLAKLGFPEARDVRVGRYIEINLEAPSKEQAGKRVDEMCKKLLANLVIEEYRYEIT